MKIAIVHSFYRSSFPSGENASVLSQIEILRSRGHEVQLFSQNSDEEIQKALYSLRSGLSVITGIGPSPLEVIRKFGPQITHVHNLYPNFGTRWLTRLNTPLVATVHNFRAVCANGLLFREGQNCTECISKGSFQAVRHGCYHNSKAASLPIAMSNRGGVKSNALIRHSDALIVLSAQAKKQLTQFGYPNHLLHVIPNGIPEAPLSSGDSKQRRWISVGRLSAEKGFAELAGMWPTTELLDIVGDGPERTRIEQEKCASIQLAGTLTPQQIIEILPKYQGLILPSICFEMQPTVISEALSRGIPIIARVGNSGSDLVERFHVGANYSDAISLRTALDEVVRNQVELNLRSRQLFRQEFSTESWATRIEHLYANLI